ncbi:hypothetical protein H2200_004775 [Cladophialophora chaetospira]|uniref:Uncharacterized protein n=1 Tax=Cladophialophora chaetospira TaxID=386627 RepID=A0AA38XDQ9_9EURO|nr:hypothetical protein H2200_004775 [Cladophialophora chaetospira]
MTGNGLIVGGVVGVTASSIFFGANLGMSFVFIPTILLPGPASTLPAQASGENRASQTSNSTQRPATKPEHLARQWLATYDIGKKAGPFFALTATGSWLYTALTLPAGLGTQQRLLAAASFLSVSIVPFTFTVMKRTNDELMRRADSATKGEEDKRNAGAEKGTVETYQTHDLLWRWAKLNFM